MNNHVLAEDLYLFILLDPETYDARLRAARVPMLHQKRKAFVKLARAGWKEYQAEYPGSVIGSDALIWAAEKLLEDTMIHVMEMDAPKGKQFFVVDGAIGKFNRFGFILKYGFPVSNMGTVKGEFFRLAQAINAAPVGVAIYRVFLERYYRVQSIKQLRTAETSAIMNT